MREVSFLFEKRTDLALEARELWQESAGKTTRLPGVKAPGNKTAGLPLTRVDILDEAGKQALGKPVGSYRTLDLTAFWQRGDGFFDRAVQAAGAAAPGAAAGAGDRSGSWIGKSGHDAGRRRSAGSG